MHISKSTFAGLMVVWSILVCASLAQGQQTATASPALVRSAAPVKDQAWKLPLSSDVSLDMIWIPAGTFTMGSPEDEPTSRADERPRMKVTLTRGYWIGKTHFTIGHWKAATGDGVRDQLIKVINDDTLYDLGGRKQAVRDFMRFRKDVDPAQYMSKEDADLPMYMVSWNDAMALCKKLTEKERAAGRLPEGYEYTLPTEAQFEYAMRAGMTEATYAGPMVGEGNRYPVVDKIAWYSFNSPDGYVGKGFNTGGRNAGPHPVGQLQPNAWGLYDMAGNIWQWCFDYYGPYPGGEVTDPTGPTTGTDRINRGGSFGSPASNGRSASRAKNPQAEASAYRGFRPALCPVK